jgi:hypothetical protein
LNSRGVAVVNFRRKYAPYRRRHRQGAPKPFFGDTGAIFAFLRRFSAAWGGLGLYVFIPSIALVLGALKDKIHAGGF